MKRISLCILIAISAVGLTACNAMPDIPVEEVGKTCVASAPAPDVSIHVATIEALPQYLSVEIDGSTPFIDECNKPFEPGATLIRTGPKSAIFMTLVTDDYFGQYGDPKPGTRMSAKVYGRNSCAEPQVEIASLSDIVIQWKLYAYDNGSCSYNVWRGRVE